MKFGIEPDKTTICIGYNASKSQQHLNVISEIDRLPMSIKKRIYIIVPLTYGGNRDYIDLVCSRLKETNLPYIVFTNFMDENEIAQLRVATDIFINCQTTDALSASLLEAMYSGAYIINASWLRYPELDSLNIKFKTIEDFADINRILAEFFLEKNERNMNNADVINELYSWDSCIKNWKEVLDPKS